MVAIRLIYCPVPDLASGRQLARLLIEERLAACVNLLPGLVSCYRWEGAVAEDDEVLLLAKTSAIRVEALRQRLSEAHPYAVPAILDWSIAGCNDAFANWLIGEVAEPS